MSIPSSRSNGIISLTASNMPLCLASWPSSSLAQALQQPHAEQPDSPEPQPQILFSGQIHRHHWKNIIFPYAIPHSDEHCLATLIYLLSDKCYKCYKGIIMNTFPPSNSCVLLPSWYSVWPSTADTTGTVASAVSTHSADHTLVQLPFVHAWLAHHALLFLLF